MKRVLIAFVDGVRAKSAIRRKRALKRAAEEKEIRDEMYLREAQEPIYKSAHDS
jgi:hypothetical protein